MQKLETYTQYCRDFIIDRLSNFENDTFNKDQLLSELTEYVCSNGSITHDSIESKAYIYEWWADCAYYWDHEKGMTGDSFPNPFSNPDLFHTNMVIEGVDSLLSQCKEFEDENSKVKLTEDVIRSIEDQLENIEISFLN